MWSLITDFHAPIYEIAVDWLGEIATFDAVCGWLSLHHLVEIIILLLPYYYRNH